MNRLQRKCLFTSAALHGLLLLVLFLGSAFLDSKPDRFELPLLDFIPAKLIDAELHGGGNPQTRPAPSPPVEEPVPAPAPRPRPAPVESERPRRQPEPRVQPEPPPRTKEPEVKVAEPRRAPEKPKIVVQTQTTRVTPPRPADNTAEARRKAEELEKKFKERLNRLSDELTTRTTVDVPGPGGEAFANYRQAIISIYQQAWIKPVGVEEAEVVKARVTIARNGRVISARITRLSGNRAVDDSVEQVLQRVKEVRPFPQGATDERRTFDLSFELAPADLAG